jgi:hypothetical protein
MSLVMMMVGKEGFRYEARGADAEADYGLLKLVLPYEIGTGI